METPNPSKRTSKRSKRSSDHASLAESKGMKLSKKLIKSRLGIPGVSLGFLGLGKSSRVFSMMFAFMMMVLVRITPTQLGMRMNGDLYSPGDISRYSAASVTPEEKILGGSLAPKGRYPYMVNIVSVSPDSRRRFCGGVLIKPDTVLTAAHCALRYYHHPWRLRAQTGRYDISEREEKGGEEFEATNIAIHPRFNNDLDYDFALITLNGESSAPTVKLSNTMSVSAGELGTALGWGGIDLRGTPAVRLRQIELKVENHKSCRAKHKLAKTRVHDSNICVLPKEGEISERNVYYGDSGGPFIVDRHGEDVVVGIASRIFPVQWMNGGFPSIFAKVPSAYSWIKSEASL